ncbi:hypothetical protein [Kribbella sp. NPDC049227]|uniref:DUF7144 family membrane protein n=1 Tax=Kribbella sp. NPDC049227 TaxID=3364113 RepID=UPI003716A81E
MAEGGGKKLAGFVVFAGALLMVEGLINVVHGLTALLSDERLGMHQERLVIVNVTAWGWVVLISGLLLIPIGGALLTGAPWSRIAGIVVVSLHAVTQIAWLSAYPVWAVLMLALDVIVLYALTARWSEVQDSLGGVGDAPWSAMEGPEYSQADRGPAPPHV